MSVNRGKPASKPQRQPRRGRSSDRKIQPFPTADTPHSSGGLTSVSGLSTSTQSVEAEPVTTAIAADSAAPLPEPRSNRRRRRANPIVRLLRWVRQLLLTWQFLIGAAFFTTLSAASLAIAFIVQLPGLPNCPAIFWPLASASMRFECARIAASKQTANDLLEAITLVDGLPPSHEMRAEADRLIELWSQEVLKLADELFQKGKLNEAIAAAQKIPSKVTAYQLVEKRITTWQSIWSKAETIYHQAEAALRKRDWRKAFEQAVRLLDIENKYWQTTRYDDLNNRINTARIDGNKLFKAEWLADAGDLASLKQAIKLAEEIGRDSYIYPLAQVKIQAFGRQMLELAQKSLNRRDLQEALSIINQIPASAKVESEKRDLIILANAQSSVWLDTVPGLEEAITQAQRISPGRPYYQKAQGLITRWQYEIEGLAQIDRARLLAQTGTIEALQAAIMAASQVQSVNPRWNEAQAEIKKWQVASETIVDRPILNQAEQFASYGDLTSLQNAITQASQIAPGRSLYTTAQQKIQNWAQQVEQMQDQPYLDQARSYAFAGNWQAAIDVASRIQPRRALYSEAQAEITKWRSQIQAQIERAQAAQAQAQAQRNLQDARQLASTGNAVALANAIRVASQVSTSGSVQAEINAAMNEWSWQLLQLAREQASALNIPAAIATAQKIPPRTAAYAEAQAQIQTWHQSPAKPTSTP